MQLFNDYSNKALVQFDYEIYQAAKRLGQSNDFKNYTQEELCNIIYKRLLNGELY